MDERMTLLASYLDDGGWHTEAENVRNGVDLESYENELRLIAWLTAHLAQPAQAVDVGMVREVIDELNDYCEASDDSCYGTLSTSLVRGYTGRLTRAIGNAQAEGWNINKRGDVWDVTYTPPTQDTPMPMNDEVRKAVEECAAQGCESAAETIRAELTRLTEIADSVDPLVVRLGDVTTKLEAANALLREIMEFGEDRRVHIRIQAHLSENGHV